MQALFPHNLRENGIKVVCFDLGGVLVRISPTWNEAARQCGVQISLDESAPLSAFDGIDKLQEGFLSDKQYFSALGKFLGVTSEEACLVHDNILVEPYEGSLEVVNSLIEAGVSVGCLSNTNDRHWQTMMAGEYPAVSRLAHQWLSHELRLSKPDSRIYRAFEKISGAEPGEILFFDDNEGNVKGAKHCGWTAHLVDPASPVSELRSILWH